MLPQIPPEETIRVPDITGIGIYTTSPLEVTLFNPRVPVLIEDSPSINA